MINIKNLKKYLIAFIFPFCICLAIFYFKGVFKNIDSLFVSDLRGQHIVFFNYLKNVLLGNASMFYSFNAGMGSSMLSTIIFYCSSPINLLLLIIEDVRYAILFIYIVKVSLAGLTMFIFLKNKMKQDDFIIVLFSTCYALCSFVVNYFFCIFWFDSIYLAPLVVLGIDRIIKYEKMNLLYIFSLALAIVCNIQMGFGLCIFSLSYYIYLYNVNYSIKNDFKKFKQIGIVFIISSLCAVAISSGALLGFFFDYVNNSSARELFGNITSYVSNLGYVIKNLFTVGSLKNSYYNNYEPYIYCGLVVSFFSILYFFNNDITTKKRISAFCVIVVFILSFCIGFLNLFWHLTSPILLNFRYSVYLSLFLIMLACECYVKKKKLTKKDIVLLFLFLLIDFFIILGYSNEIYAIWTFIFLVLIFCFILLTKNKTKKFEILLFLGIIAEIFMNGYLSIYTTNDIPSGEVVSYDSFKKISSFFNFDDSYRVMYNYSFVEFNDTLFLNKNSSLRYFSSIVNDKVSNFYDRNWSYKGDNGYFLSAYDSPLLISLMGNKYFYFTSELNNSIYKKIDSYKVNDFNKKKTVYLYENPYALSLGYVIENDVKYDKKMDLVDYQNKIIKSFTGIDKDVMIRLEHMTLTDSDMCDESTFYSCKVYEIFNDTNNVLVYVYRDYASYSVFNNTKSYKDSCNKPILLSTIDKKILLKFEDNEFIDDSYFVTATYDEVNLIDSLSFLQQNMLENIKIDSNTLVGEINSNKEGILFLTIPYSDNFNIYVDGKEVDYYSVLDKTFIGLDINKGKHDIVVSYSDKSYKMYIILTILSIIITFVLYYFINKLIQKRKIEEEFNAKKVNVSKYKLSKKCESKINKNELKSNKKSKKKRKSK